MKAGPMRHIVALQRNTPTPDSATNQPIESWEAVAIDIPCHVESVSGSEVRRGMQMDATTTHLVRIHHPFGAFTVGPKDRLYWTSESMYLNVVSSLDRDGMKRELTIQCKVDA